MRRKTKKLIDAARRNGALSQGPTTPQGKAVSSRNALKHGLSASQPFFNPIEQEHFDRFAEQFIRAAHPADGIELFLVQEAARSAWLRRRAERLQVRLLDLEVDVLAPSLSELLGPEADYTTLLTLALRSLTETSPTFTAMDHHARRHSRDLFRTLSELHKRAAARILKNEPVCEQPSSYQYLTEHPECPEK